MARDKTPNSAPPIREPEFVFETKKLPSGFEFQVARPSPQVIETQRRHGEVLERVRQRIETWLARAASPRKRPGLTISPDEAAAIVSAIHVAESSADLLQQLDDLARRDHALRSLYRKGGNPRVLAKALGWAPGKRGTKRDVEQIVTDYFILLGQSPRHGLLIVPQERVGVWAHPRPQTPAQAIRTLTQLYPDFGKPANCREFLVRLRRRLMRENPSPQFGTLRSDIPIPHADEL